MVAAEAVQNFQEALRPRFEGTVLLEKTNLVMPALIFPIHCQSKQQTKTSTFHVSFQAADKDKFKAASALGLFIYFLLKFLIF